jgi:hypothetical protein
MLPLTLVPISGINNAINKTILINIKIQSSLYKISDGINKNIDIDMRPMDINNI